MYNYSECSLYLPYNIEKGNSACYRDLFKTIFTKIYLNRNVLC